ncbi:MAG: CBS domain-containing protein [Candidatus Micrarchaeota archaeon]
MVIINLDDIDTISSKIRSARVMLGISQARLAKEAGVSQSTIARLEKECRKLNPSYSMVYNIVTALNRLSSSEQTIDQMEVKDLMHGRLIFVKPTDSIKKAITIMKENDYSQIPVMENGKVLGTVYQKDLVGFASNPKKASIRIEKVMGVPLPEIDENTKVGMIKSVLESWGAAIVKRKDRAVGIFTIYDLFKASKI